MIMRSCGPMYVLLGRLGLGRRTGLPVPAEVPGLVTPLHRWSRNYTLASVAFGQELGVSATQMAAAASTLLDGLYRPPRLVHGLTDGEGVSLKNSVNFRGSRLSTRERPQESGASWHGLWMRGTCAEMRIPGIPVAGKTGTAQCETKKGAEVHSYVALAPADDPSLTLVVVVREPQGVRYASQSAAPAAGRILRRLLPYLGFFTRGRGIGRVRTLDSAILRRLMKHSVNRLPLGRLCASLHNVLSDVAVSGPDPRVTGLSADSRSTRPGDLFIAAPGVRHDGLAHVKEALSRGATAVLAARRPELPEDIGFCRSA